MTQAEKRYYYSHDDRHNEPYVAGPYDRDELLRRIPSERVDELIEEGTALDGGESYDLHEPKEREAYANNILEEAVAMYRGDSLPTFGATLDVLTPMLRLLHHSRRDINFEYDKLTPNERARLSQEEHAAILTLIKGRDFQE